MRQGELTGKVQTVLGIIDADSLGVTLPHEHLIVDALFLSVEPTEATEKRLAHQPITLENLYWVKLHARNHADNLKFTDEKLAIKEALLYKGAGGNTIVELTPIGLARDPLGLARIARATGLNVVMGSGYYVEGSYSKESMEAKTDNDIAEEIVKDMTVGVDDSGIRSGVIGELGCTWPLKDNERKVLRAGAYAQKRTGAAIWVHPGRNEMAPIEEVEALADAGADLSRVVICHIDRCGYLMDTRQKLLDSGCYLEYDVFGWEGYYPAEVALAEGHLPDILNDVGRIKEIKELIGMGYLKQILLSQDIACKTMLVSYGGWGYAHLLREVVPLMKIYGISDEQINTMMVDNPKRLLPFAPTKE